MWAVLHHISWYDPRLNLLILAAIFTFHRCISAMKCPAKVGLRTSPVSLMIFLFHACEVKTLPFGEGLACCCRFICCQTGLVSYACVPQLERRSRCPKCFWLHTRGAKCEGRRARAFFCSVHVPVLFLVFFSFLLIVLDFMEVFLMDELRCRWEWSHGHFISVLKKRLATDCGVRASCVFSLSFI